MRICVVYDCLYPWTVGGAERWYRNLAERLAADGHEVTYLTRLQWDPANPPAVPGVRVLPVSGADPLYGEDGNRRIAPPLRFGRGVLRHLLRHGDGYDVVHTGSFPYFSLLAAGLTRRRRGFHLVVDWIEVWSESYWHEYLGLVAGAIGHEVQRACVRIPQQAFCFSRLVRDRLLEEGLRSAPEILSGIYAGPLRPPEPNHAEPVVVFAGRHIPEKRAPAVVPAVRLARAQVPGLRGTVFGDGPQRPAVVEAIAREGVAGVVEAPGFVDAEQIDVALRAALCMLLPSVREGYGLIVVESAAHGTPSVVVRSADNAAVELVEDGVNGVVAESDDPRDLAAAIVRVHAMGDALRASTCAWFAQHAPRLSLGRALEQVSARYGRREPSARA